jgi:hypothetical protein
MRVGRHTRICRLRALMEVILLKGEENVMNVRKVTAQGQVVGGRQSRPGAALSRGKLTWGGPVMTDDWEDDNRHGATWGLGPTRCRVVRWEGRRRSVPLGAGR